MASRDRVAEAEECKAKGNEALQAKNFDKAIEWYNEAIKLHKGHVYFSNRSAAYLSKGFGETALKDAEECIKLKPDWVKGYGRKGAALHKLGKYDEAIAAYQKGLEMEPGNQSMKQGIESVTAAKAGPQGGGGGNNPLGQLFGPNFMEKVKAHPKLSKYMNDATYVQTLTMLQQNPNLLQFAAQDPRIRETFEALLGIRFQAEEDVSRDAEMEAARRKEEEERKAAGKKAKEEAEKRRKEEEERIRRENETPEERQKREAKERAQELKSQGNEHYKKRDFDKALELYREALELDPEEMMILLNISAVQLEMDDLDACVKSVHEAIKLGRSVYAPYEKVAKAYTRLGNAYFKHKKYAEAKKAYEEAQLEFNQREVADKIRKVEKLIKKAEEEAYIDPELAKEAKERGNTLFKSGDFPGSIKEYSEAVRRDPSNAVYYGNRAAAYMKLADFGRAMDDCKKSLELDPAYVKMYARKGNIEFFLKEYHKALDSFQKGLELDPANEECRQGLAKTQYAVQTSQGEGNQERAARAMEDPEIRNIMSDPVMKNVLQDLSSNPQSAQKHLANPEIASKIQKLIAAGIIQTG